MANVTAEQRAAFLAAIGAGADRSTAALHAGLDGEEMASWLTGDLLTATRRAEAQVDVANVATVKRAAQAGDWHAAAALLDRKKRQPAPDSVYCGAASKRTHEPCRMRKGSRTDHPGLGNCWLHGGRSPNGRRHAEREARAQEALQAFADLTLSKIGDALAREAASRAFATEEEDSEAFGRNVGAFQRAAERAEGSKLTIESKIAFLAELPDEELDAAIAEAERLLADARAAGGRP